MELKLRRIGNSLGVLLPRSLVERLGVVAGDVLEVDAEAFQLAHYAENAHTRLDAAKLQLAQKLLSAMRLADIRSLSLARLEQWKRQGAWVSAYEEWQRILCDGSDQELLDALVGLSDKSNRLRQSPPFVGLTPGRAPSEVTT